MVYSFTSEYHGNTLLTDTIELLIALDYCEFLEGIRAGLWHHFCYKIECIIHRFVCRVDSTIAVTVNEISIPIRKS